MLISHPWYSKVMADNTVLYRKAIHLFVSQELGKLFSSKKGKRIVFVLWKSIRKPTVPTGHTMMLRRCINIIDVDSTSQQRRMPSGEVCGLVFPFQFLRIQQMKGLARFFASASVAVLFTSGASDPAGLSCSYGASRIHVVAGRCPALGQRPAPTRTRPLAMQSPLLSSRLSRLAHLDGQGISSPVPGGPGLRPVHVDWRNNYLHSHACSLYCVSCRADSLTARPVFTTFLIIHL